MSDTSSRLLQLLSLLQGRRDWPGDELGERLAVSTRTIRRDVERLRELGYPVESITGPAGGYRLRAGTAMPPLLLDDEEAIAIAVGLRAAAGASVSGIEETSVRALVKLEQVLPAHLRRRVAALSQATFTLPLAGPRVEPQHLSAIAAACRDRERLRFDYVRRDGDEARREVEPHALVNRGRRWYLLAWDCNREDWRTFRVDRIAKPSAGGTRFAPRTLPARDAGAFVEQSIASAPNKFEARVTLHVAAEEIAPRLSPHWGKLEPIDARTCHYRTGDEDLKWLALRLAMLGVDFEVHDPPELIEHLRLLADRLSRAANHAHQRDYPRSTRGPSD
jgi:predicted DNA-binding transcriptional regulator YafY